MYVELVAPDMLVHVELLVELCHWYVIVLWHLEAAALLLNAAVVPKHIADAGPLYKYTNNTGYKTAKRRITMEIRDLAIAMIVVQCGGNPSV